MCSLLASLVFSKILDIQDFGAKPTSQLYSSSDNCAAFSKALSTADAGDEVIVPGNLTFVIIGGVAATNLRHVTIRIQGNII